MQEQKKDYLSLAICMQDDALGYQAENGSTVCTDLRLKWVSVTVDPSFRGSCSTHLHCSVPASYAYFWAPPHKAPLLQMHPMQSF
jgi:hypothetical protein